MDVLFYIAAAVAVISTVLVVTRAHAIHALLYFIVSLFSMAVVFFTLGAPFVAALEVIVYAGAIMVLFVFVVMLLNLGDRAALEEKMLLSPGIWVGPAVLAFILAVELAFVVARTGGAVGRVEVGPREVGMSLFGPYVLGVELASMLLMAGLVGAYHLGRRRSAGGGGAMNGVPLAHAFYLAAVLFVLGLVGLLSRRNILFMLISIEVMLNSAGLAFVAAGARWAAPDGQVMFVFILATAAAEVSVGLALVLLLVRSRKTLDTDAADEMRG